MVAKIKLRVSLATRGEHERVGNGHSAAALWPWKAHPFDHFHNALFDVFVAHGVLTGFRGLNQARSRDNPERNHFTLKVWTL